MLDYYSALDQKQMPKGQTHLGTSRTKLVSFQEPRSNICLNVKVKSCLQPMHLFVFGLLYI